MAQLIVRKLPDEVVASLKERASRNGRSVEAEVRDMLQYLTKDRKAQALAEMAELRESLRGQTRPDSTDLVRAYRDNNFEPLPEDAE